jgi:uncharacterized membrane protein YphA (DoxX/SURF4 family)
MRDLTAVVTPSSQGHGRADGVNLTTPATAKAMNEGHQGPTIADARLATASQVLRIGLGVGAFVAGLDKFFNLLTTWSMYLSPLAERLLPVGDGAFMRGIGVVEMLVGLAILTRWTRLGAYAMATWLVAIAVNLAISGSFWDLALRDVEIALSAFTLGRLTEWRARRIPTSGAAGGLGHVLSGGAAA